MQVVVGVCFVDRGAPDIARTGIGVAQQSCLPRLRLGIREMSDSLVCTACSSKKIEAIVEYGSYVLRCSECGDGIVATSFLAMRDVEGEFWAYHDPGHGNQPCPEAQIAKGSLKQIHQAISSVAEAGSSVLLVATQPGIAADGLADR